MSIPTEALPEELTDPVPEAEVTAQTDAVMDRPPTPLFIPMKIGVDVETQIEAGDLFDFNFEVEPILEVLVGKAPEQGLREVMEGDGGWFGWVAVGRAPTARLEDGLSVPGAE